MSTTLAGAALAGGPLAWDGSYVLFTTLDQQTLYSSHGRYYHTLLTAPTLLLSQFTSRMDVLAVSYTIPEVIVPFAALVASWRVVRNVRPSLFVWPALGIGAVTLPGQFGFDSEGLASVQIFWPLFLLILVKKDGVRDYLSIGTLAVVQLLIYPMAMVYFAVVSMTALLLACAKPDERLANGTLALSFALVAFARFLVPRSDYDSQIIFGGHLLDTLQGAFQHSVSGRPLAAIVCASAAGVLVVLGYWSGLTRRRSVAGVAILVAVLCLAAAAAVLIPWANDPSRWAPVESFRFWAFAVSVPLLCMALADQLAFGHAFLPDSWQWTPVVYGAGALFCIVISLQSLGWLELNRRLKIDLAAFGQSCVNPNSMTWLTDTGLSYWSTPYLALIAQGRSPSALLLYDNGCAAAEGGGDIQLAPWARRSRNSGWFDLTRSGLGSAR